MPYVPQTKHVDRIRNVIEGRMTRPGADASRLASSYRRSLEMYHLDPGATIGPRILTTPELRDVQHREETFLRASGQCLSRLHEMVREADYCVMLTDAQGVTIDYRVDRDRRQEFKRAGLYLGSCWSENEEGTCGVAAVLQDAASITVHKADHFRAAFTTLTCSASPILGLQGDLIGVLDASAVRSPEERDSQRLVNHMVRQSALLIEDAFFLDATTHHWVVLAHRSRPYLDVRPEILIALDARGNVIAANRRARECIPGLSQMPIHVTQIVDVASDRLLNTKVGSAPVALRMSGTGAALYARVRPPVMNSTRSNRVREKQSVASKEVALPEAEFGERARVLAAMTDAKWQAEEAAKSLGISRATLYRRIAKYDIVPPHKR